MKFSLMMLLIALTMCGCKCYAIRSVDVLDDPEFIVVPTETILGESEQHGPYEYSATVAVNVNLPQKAPYRQFAERVISDAVYRRGNCVRQAYLGARNYLTWYNRTLKTPNEAVTTKWLLQPFVDDFWAVF